MIWRAGLLIAVALVARVAAADPESDAERDFYAAAQRAARGDPHAIDAFEAIGNAALTRWTDDAWVEAARLAERAGDLPRARRDYERAIAIGSDPRLVERARGDLARLAVITGGGAWDRVAAEHDRLASEVLAPGDPKPALAKLEALARDNLGYPRRAAAILLIAQAWERDGNPERALEWLATASSPDQADQHRLSIALVRMLIRHGELERAAEHLSAYAAQPDPDRAVVTELRGALSRAEHRRWLRRGLWGLLVVIALGAALVLWRDAGGWRRALVMLRRPPLEVVFLLPIGLVLVLVAATGNPLVSRAVRQIVIAGLAIAWLSGSLLEAARVRGAVGARRAIAQAAIAIAAVGSIAYLSLDHDRMIDLVLETWRSGPAMR